MLRLPYKTTPTHIHGLDNYEESSVFGGMKLTEMPNEMYLEQSEHIWLLKLLQFDFVLTISDIG